MEEVTAIGFDFDDTLVFSEKTKETILTDIFAKEYGVKAGVVHAYRDLRGKASREEKIERLIQTLTGREPEGGEIERISGVFAEQYRARLATCPVASCIEAIKEVKKYVKLLFLVSLENTKEVVLVAEHCGIAGHFDVILGGPASKRENFRRIIEEYRIVPAETLYVGDSKRDVIIAGECGFKAVGIQRDFSARDLMQKLGAYVTYCDLCAFSHDFFAHFEQHP